MNPYADAACLGHDVNLWFPHEHQPTPGHRLYDDARAICHTCTIQTRCLDDALTEEAQFPATRHGMRGGLSPRQRMVVAQHRRQGVAT